MIIDLNIRTKNTFLCTVKVFNFDIWDLYGFYLCKNNDNTSYDVSLNKSKKSGNFLFLLFSAGV